MEMTDVCDGDYLGAYRRFLEHFVDNVFEDDQLPVRMACREVRECEVAGAIADITLKHLNQRICPPSLQAYLVKLVREECKILFQKQPEECGYRPYEKKFSPLKLMQTVTNKVNEICQRYLDNSRLALLPPPPSIPLPLASSYAIKNRRRKMEDRSVVLHDLHTMFSIKNEAVVNYYAVFDGHGGPETATYCAAHLHQYLIESPYYPVEPELALRDAFHTTDCRFIECDDTNNSGATAVCALLYDKTLYIAWAGDSQAALIKNGRGINLTIPHKPERPDEKARIEALGGEVIFYGSWRVNGVLNVSRSLGDAKYKPFISGVPDIKKIELDGTEDFLIVACDGFWERATEDIVASLLYEYVASGNCDYNSASVALVNWAKQNFSEDNISVIVVFLTPPAEIAAKSFFEPRPAPQSNAMEHPGYQEQQDGPFELDFNFAKHQQQPLPADPAVQHTNGNDETRFVPGLESLNGRHRPKPPRYNDDDDDDEEEEEGDVDLGPETNVDAVDDAPEDYGKLDQAMGQNYPDDFLVNAQPDKRDQRDDFPVEMKQRHQNELIAEADNVADSEDSEDEWNYYRPEENKQQHQQNSDSLGPNLQKDPALVEKPDQCYEEKEPCSPKPCEEDNDSEDNSQSAEQRLPEQTASNQQQLSCGEEAAAAATTDDADAEDVITAEFDELHQHQIINDQHQLKELDTEAEAVSIPEDIPYDREPEEKHSEEQQLDAQHIQEEQPEAQQQHLQQELHEQLDKIKPEQEVDTQEEDDMESHLNPDAEEFVPTSTNTSPPLMPQLMNQIDSDVVAGSPLKQSQRALKNRKIPSEQEFKEEICRRPSEIDNSNISDYSNGDNQSPMKDITSNNLIGGFEDENQCTVINPLNLDESEISSTRAEFGDDSTANFSVASELYKTGLSTIDCSYTGSERSDFEFSSKDPMATSMTPGDFKTAFEQEPDLNKVHELNDDDLMGDIQNGTIEEVAQNVVETEDDDLVKEKIELDFENFVPQQQQSAEIFSAIVEQRESSSNKDMFMNLRNSEHEYELEQSKEEHNLIDPSAESNVTSTANEKVAEFAMDNSPVYATNNPFSADYVPASDLVNNVLIDDMQNVTLEEPQKLSFEETSVPTPEEPEMQKSVHDEVMHNPLDLNFGGSSAEQKTDEPVLVSPIKEPQVMSSKFEEEDLMSRSVEALHLQQSQQHDQDEFISKNNHVEDLSPVSVQPEENVVALPEDEIHDVVTEPLERKSINLSESLQEFTGLEEQLSPKHEVKDNEAETPQILKENLVDEQKDVEEAKAPSLIDEPKLEEAPQVSNELPASNETAGDVVSMTAVATAAATAVAAGSAATTKSTKSSTAISKTSKTAITSKVGSKSTTPTSPSKNTGVNKAGTNTLTKKPAPTSTTSRAKPATGTTTKLATSSSSKTPALTKTTNASKNVTSPSAATKATNRVGATTTAASRAKPLSSVTSKISSTTTTEKKPTANGEVKPPPIGRSAPPPKAKPPTSTNSTASKSGLVSKTSTTTRSSTGATATTAPKARPASASATKTTTSRLNSVNVTSSTNSASARPKTAPTSTLTATAKSKVLVSTGAKSPMIDKQIKETANKQISSSRSSTTNAITKSRLSTVTSSITTTSATKRTSLIQKSSITGVNPSPTKKAPVASKAGTKNSSVTSKANSKVTSTTKTSVTNPTTKVVQNGVCEAENPVEITTNKTTTETTNIEEDIPKKDISPIEPVTDNQLITAE